MTPREFVQKWEVQTSTERANAQAHYLDLCELLRVPKPQEEDASGKDYGFEVGLTKSGGGQGWADVFRRGKFAMEYKGLHKDLNKAYAQLRQYAGDLANPPYLLVCDLHTIIGYTNFTGYVTERKEIRLHDLLDSHKRDQLTWMLEGSPVLKPKQTTAELTGKIANEFADVAEKLRGRGFDPHDVAVFISRIAFCMFAEDVGILPKGLFTGILERAYVEPAAFPSLTSDLFRAMKDGGWFGTERIKHINGGLFSDTGALEMTKGEIERVRTAARQDWNELDPTILGTLFERGLDPAKRASLGAHYTDEASIARIVEPVVIAPLEREWEAARDGIIAAKSDAEKRKRYGAFRDRLASVRILDPACGSGNFLYVALRRLLDLELRVINAAPALGITQTLIGTETEVKPRCGPHNVFGIELSEYAAELAHMSVWIGDLQWVLEKGFGENTPVLQALENIQNRDALLNPDGSEAKWPEAEFIIGNPPFLGGKLLRSNLGDVYVDRLFRAYDGRVPREADLCTYWFEKARGAIETSSLPKKRSEPVERSQGSVTSTMTLEGSQRHPRAGLIATQGIRGGANRRVLERIKESGDIFLAWSDLPWVLEGAAVHVSIVAFDDGSQWSRTLNGEPAETIHANLTGEAAVHQAKALGANLRLCFMGTTKGGPFDVTEERVRPWLEDPNPHGRPNSDVLVPWVNGRDVTQRSRGMWIVDFGVGRSREEAAMYEAPFRYAETFIEPERRGNNREHYARVWWQQVEPRPGMRTALGPLQRFVVSPGTTKYRMFSWMEAPLQPDHALFAFAYEDDYHFGVLHSRFHEAWALFQGTRLEDRPRYTPTTCFETFPFPEASAAQREEISHAARELDALRERWLNPPEWTQPSALGFPATVGGPWDRLIVGREGLAAGEIGTARYVRSVPKRGQEAALAKRTLTNLYNERPGWLRLAHERLDAAVAEAYGLAADLPTAGVLAALLERNVGAVGRG